ncbi:hypothetical protein [Carboxylicivirga sp. N1Y90]|uniref:hypothetical protein n=1 Tax=Carboxylicivirga fragile TaxID=3417571 RepID=UPI003D32B156|nr:hypothetical protein [Marinilabiliaceae bacterium N1Y90]
MKKYILLTALLISATNIFSQKTWNNKSVSTEVVVYSPPLINPIVTIKFDYDYTLHPNGYEEVSNVKNVSLIGFNYGSILASNLVFGIENNCYINFTFSGYATAGQQLQFFGQLMYKGKREPSSTGGGTGGGGFGGGDIQNPN